MMKTLTIREAAVMARCHYNTIALAIKNGDMQAYRPAQQFLIKEEDFFAWFESKKIRSSRMGRPRQGPPAVHHARQ